LLSFGVESFVFSFLSKNINLKVYRTIILTVVLYGSETWSLTLREKRMLRMFENMVLRKIFGPKRNELRCATHIIGQCGLSYTAFIRLHLTAIFIMLRRADEPQMSVCEPYFKTPEKKCNFERRLNARLLHERHRVFVLSNLLNFKANIMYGTKYLFRIFSKYLPGREMS
jgi:hypothetical protein